MSESNSIYIQKALNELMVDKDKINEEIDLIRRELENLETHAELEALEKPEKSQEITRIISFYKKKITLLWQQKVETSKAINELQDLLNIEQNVIQENNSYQPTFKEETSNNVYGRRAQYVQPNINNEVLGQASNQKNMQSGESTQVEAEQSIQPNINNEVLGQALYQENAQSEESLQEEEFDDDLFVEDEVERKYRESVEQKIKQGVYQENMQSGESTQVEAEQSIQSNINNEVLGQALYQENAQSEESTQEETKQTIQSNINNEELKQASNQKNMQSEKSTQVKQEFKDGLFDDEEKIKASFIGRDGIEIVINRITCKNGIYTISYDRHEKNKTIRGLKKTREIGNKLINKKYLRREFKKKNNSNLLNLLESNNIEFNLSYFLIQEFDKKFGTKIDQSYRNKELCVEYDLGDILTWKSLNKSSAIDLYRIALNQEKNGNANILRHSKMCLMMIKAIDKYKDSKGNNNQKNINETNNATKRSKNEKSSIQDWGQKTKLKNDKAKESTTSNECKTKWDELESVRARFSNLDADNIKYSGNNDFTQEKNSNDKKNNIFTRTKIKIMSIAAAAIFVVGSIGGIISKKYDSKGSNDPKVEASNIGSAISNVFTKESDSKGSNDSKDLAQKDTYNFNPEVKDVLTLVYRDASGKLSREYLLTSDKFGEGEKYASSKCGGDLFKISDITVYNKDTKETIDIIKAEGLNAQSLYGKYGADIGVSICLNVCDEEFNVISNEKYYLDYDSYARISDASKQKIYEDNSSKYAKEDEIAKTTKGVTTQNVPSETETQETKQPEKKTNVQYSASYADSGNNARLLYTDEDGNIIKACKWTSGSDGTGTSGSGKNLDCDSYKFSLVVARNKNEVLKTVVVKKENKSVEQIVAELYETYGNDIQIIYNFDGYQDGKLTDELLGFISKEAYDEFQNITLSEEDKFYGELESTLAKNKAFKGYKLTLNI